MPIDGERFRYRSLFLLIDLLTTMHPHRGFCLPNFFHTVLAQLAELRSPRCVYSIARTLKASRRSCRPLQIRRRCREWPKTMQRKTEKPHGYSFSEHPCGFMAWSRIRDSNSHKTTRTRRIFAIADFLQTRRPCGQRASARPGPAWCRLRPGRPGAPFRCPHGPASARRPPWGSALGTARSHTSAGTGAG